jgi:hypothetical protein
MEHGRSHDERTQKVGTRTQEQTRRDDPELDEQRFTRQAQSTDPAPTRKAQEAEIERHEREGTIGGHVDKET